MTGWPAYVAGRNLGVMQRTSFGIVSPRGMHTVGGLSARDLGWLHQLDRPPRRLHGVAARIASAISAKVSRSSSRAISSVSSNCCMSGFLCMR